MSLPVLHPAPELAYGQFIFLFSFGLVDFIRYALNAIETGLKFTVVERFRIRSLDELLDEQWKFTDALNGFDEKGGKFVRGFENVRKALLVTISESQVHKGV